MCNKHLTPRLPGWQTRLAVVGEMALTSYIARAVICAFAFYGFGLGLYGQLERHQLYYVVARFGFFQLIVSPIWFKHFRFGPLEWLWRSLTYIDDNPKANRNRVRPGSQFGGRSMSFTPRSTES